MYVLCALFFFVFTAQAAELFKDSPQLKKIKDDCEKEAKVDQTIIDKINGGDLEDEKSFDKNAKCYVSCLLEKTELARPVPPNIQNIKKFFDISRDGSLVEKITKCIEEGNGKEKCEGRFMIYKCFLKNTQNEDMNESDGSKKDESKGNDEDSKSDDTMKESIGENKDGEKQNITTNDEKMQDSKDSASASVESSKSSEGDQGSGKKNGMNMKNNTKM